jgi:ATP-binding cassette subfamily C protein LapB
MSSPASIPHAAAAPGHPEAPSWDIDNDALAHAIAWLTEHHGQARSAASLLSALPMSGHLTPEHAVRALREAGYNAGVMERALADLHELLLPAVLLLGDGDACIVVARRTDGRYDVVMPGPQCHACTASAAELQAEFSGFVLVATPQVRAAPVHKDAPLLADPSQHWLWGTLRRFIPYYRGAIFAALLTNVLMLVTGLSTSIIYDKVIPHQAYVTLWTLASACTLALIFDFTARQLRAYLIDMAGKKTDLIVGAALFRHTLAVRMEHRPESSGAYAHTLGQLEVVREFFASATLSALSDLPFIAIFVAMVFLVAGPLGWVVAGAIPALLLMSLLIQGTLRRSMSANQQQHADLHGVLVEAVEGIEDLKAAGAQGRFLRRYEETTAAAATSAMKARNVTAVAGNISGIAQQIVTVMMLVWGVYLIDDKIITSGSLVGAVMFSNRAIAPLAGLVGLAMKFQGARAAMRALETVMALPVEREAGKVYTPRRDIVGHMGLHEVGFAYPHTGPGEAPRVLKGVNLRLEPGERVAVLGRIGSGKSTVLRLLAGLYQPTEGRVEVDGIDLRQIDPADFRARVGFVSQDPRLFTGTLRENVLLDRPSADPARLGDVARLTGLDRVVASHPMGWDLPVGESGGLLSGGQRQLVALSRCLVTRPQILLMDEPTSSMDGQSEAAFLRQLKQASGDCTLVMVTHRPAVLELVTRVVVIDGGRVVLDGPKDQVLAALSGARPAAPPTAANPGNLHMHPTAQPMQREASV